LLGKHFEKNELDFVLGIPGVTTMQKLGLELLRQPACI